MLTVVTAATDTDLTTAEDVRCLLGLSSADDDRLIRNLIKYASGMVVSFTGRPFAEEAYEETLAGYGTSYLQLSRTPVTELTTIELDSSAVTDVVIESAESGLLYRESGFDWTIQGTPDLEPHPLPESERKVYVATYTAGYILPSDPANRTLPYEIEAATIEIVKFLYRSRKKDPTVSRRRVGELEIFYGGTSGAVTIPHSAQAILERWKRSK